MSKDQSRCSHCNEKIVIPILLSDSQPDVIFCCQGCKTAYEILHEEDMSEYYNLRDQSESKNFGAVSPSSEKFLYLDEEEFQSNYTQVTESTKSLVFYLEGIHCLACLWLIERLPEFHPGVLESTLDMGKSTVKITLLKEHTFSSVAKLLDTLGYPPHPILEKGQEKELQKKEDQRSLIQIAIAFFGAGNIMMLAFSIYAGAEGAIRTYFDWISMFLAFPVLTYSAAPFYKNAISSIKQKSLSIDFPIVAAIILGSILSIHQTITGGENIYFDTLATLVFLLLLSRYTLKKAQQKGLSASEVSSFFSNISALKIVNGEKEEVLAKFLQPQDTIEINPGDTIPADCTIIKGKSSTNNSVLTGEVIPQPIGPGDEAFSGTINLEATVLAKVNKTAEESKLGEILKSVEKGWNQKTKIVRFADNIAKYFVTIVFSLSILTAIYFLIIGDHQAAILRPLTLIIITCPCALGLTTPLSLTLTLSRLAKKGILIKDEVVIEKLTKAKQIALDKTGTLTYGNFQVIKWEEFGVDGLAPKQFSPILSIE